MKVAPFPLAPIKVLPHALKQLRARTDLVGTDEELTRWVQERVERAVGGDQVYDVKPRNFRRIGETRSRRLPPWQRFVMCGGEIGFIVEPQPSEIIVITTLTSVPRLVIR